VNPIRGYELRLDALGPRIRVDYGGDTAEAWLRDLVGDLAEDGLVSLTERDGDLFVSLRQ